MAFNLSESRNPLLNEDKISKMSSRTLDWNETMTVSGAINKTFVLFGLLMITSLVGYLFPSTMFMLVGGIGGFVIAIIASFKPQSSATLAPIYALLKGFFVGTATAMYGAIADGLVFNAVLLTLGTLVTMLALYKYEVIKVTEKLRSGVIIATGGIFIVYLMAFIFRLFGYNVPYIHEGGMIGIGFSILVIGIAALNLLLDFDNFDKSAEANMPKYMEWFCGMSLLITIVWLYIEFLRLLAKLNSND